MTKLLKVIGRSIHGIFQASTSGGLPVALKKLDEFVHYNWRLTEEKNHLRLY